MTAIYVYVDGESHFIRSESCCRELFESHGSLEALAEANKPPHVKDGRVPQLLRSASFYWDPRFDGIASSLLSQHRTDGIYVDRRIYFTSCYGDEKQIHEARRWLRRAGFEPIVVHEPRDLAKRRDNEREQNSLIEKPKGVDISLTTRMLEDCYQGNFDACCLFTSDIDFLPVIQAVRRTGRIVHVMGYGRYLSKRSPFDYEPDVFVDLEGVMTSLRKPG